MRLRLSLAISLLLTVSCAQTRPRSPVQPVATIPFELANQLILLPVSINRSAPASFILDTGASTSVIDRAFAERLGLKLEAEKGVSTSGGSVGGSVAENAAVSLPQMELGRLNLLAIPLAGVEAGLGRAVGGILGAELFERFVVEIDYAARTIGLYESATHEYSGVAAPLPITFQDHTPFIRAVVQGSDPVPIESTLLIDTGATGAVTLNSAFVKQHRLVETSQHVIPITSGAILEGQARTYVGRLRELRFGAVRFPQAVAFFSRDTEGDEASTSNDGFIGGEVLGRFRVTTDYAHARIIMEPTDRVSDAFEFDMSGMSLAAAATNVEVVRVRLVIPGSPAAEAGVSAGDILTAIDGVQTSPLGLDKVRQMFRIEGAEHRLSLRRGDAALEVRIKMRRLI